MLAISAPRKLFFFDVIYFGFLTKQTLGKDFVSETLQLTSQAQVLNVMPWKRAVREIFQYKLLCFAFFRIPWKNIMFKYDMFRFSGSKTFFGIYFQSIRYVKKFERESEAKSFHKILSSSMNYLNIVFVTFIYFASLELNGNNLYWLRKINKKGKASFGKDRGAFDLIRFGFRDCEGI